MADHKTGYFGVRLNKRCKTEPYQARVRRGGQQVNLGSFATAEEARCASHERQRGGQRRRGLQRRCR